MQCIDYLPPKMVFEEVQRFRQWWVWVILIGTTCIPIYGLYQQVYLNKPFGTSPNSDLGLLVFLLVMLFLNALFVGSFLRTRIDEQGIHMDFIPFVRRHISWDKIAHVEVVKYGFVGGWGIRLGSRYGTVYNVSGNRGLAIKLKSGSGLVIGTQGSDALHAFLN